MSVLLNVIDGVGSEDGKIVFATVSDAHLIYSFFSEFKIDQLR